MAPIIFFMKIYLWQKAFTDVEEGGSVLRVAGPGLVHQLVQHVRAVVRLRHHVPLLHQPDHLDVYDNINDLRAST